VQRRRIEPMGNCRAGWAARLSGIGRAALWTRLRILLDTRLESAGIFGQIGTCAIRPRPHAMLTPVYINRGSDSVMGGSTAHKYLTMAAQMRVPMLFGGLRGWRRCGIMTNSDSGGSSDPRDPSHDRARVWLADFAATRANT